ncbi:hypothetical protein CVT24_006585, partial [Panaeolus cyanescens]
MPSSSTRHLPVPSIISAEDIQDKKIETRDTIIAFLGPTGSGKSHLVDTLSGQPNQRAGEQLESKTQNVRATRVRYIDEDGSSERTIVLVDTPGFDDTHRSDMEILKLIAEWLKKTYKAKIKLSGIVYTHRITDNRMSGSPHRNLRMFKELCGDDAAKRVVFSTTMWDRLTETGRVTAEEREKELRNAFWKPMIRLGSTCARFSNNPESAWNIIRDMIPKDGQGTLIQKEMVDKHMNVKETKAGIALLQGLEEVLQEQQAILGQLETTSRRHPSQSGLDEQVQQMRQTIENTTADIKQLRLPLSRRIVRIFLCG